MSDPTELAAPVESPATLPIDLVEAESLSFEDVMRLREAVYSDEDGPRHFAAILGRLDASPAGSASERSWRRSAALFILGQHEEAVDALRKGRSVPGADHLLGRSLLVLGRHAEAIETLEEAVRAKPSDVAVRTSLFEAVEASRDFAALRRLLQNAPKSFEGTAHALYCAGRLAEEEGEYESAIEHYERALAKDRNHRGALFRIAYQLDLRGMDDEALATYERLVSLSPTDANSLTNLGLLYEDRGDAERAAACYETVLRADPTNERARLFFVDARASLSMYYDEDQERKEDRLQQILRIPITDFELSVRARNCLQKMGIQNLGDLARKTEAELLAYKNFGETSLNEIRDLLTQKGLRLGMLRGEVEEDTIRRMEEEARLTRAEFEDEETLVAREQQEEQAEKRADALARPIDDLKLSARCRRILEGLELKTVGELAAKSEAELAGIEDFTSTSIQEVKDRLGDLGLSLRD